MNAGLSRRDLFSRFLQPLRNASNEKNGVQPGALEATHSLSAQDHVAVIQGRFCMALTSFCSVCVERCPVQGAMKKERGLPMVVADLCTGCGVCQDVCPAPRNAVLMLPSRRKVNPK